MRHFSIGSHHGVAIVALTANLVFLGGCSNSAVGLSAQNAASPHRVVSDGYIFQTVNFSGATDNEITGINNNGEVIGNYASSVTSTADWTSYVSKEPYSKFTSLTFPAADSTYLYAINDDASIKVGYVLHPQEQDNVPWGTVDYGGLWSLIPQRPDARDCSPRQLELLGFDNNSSSEAAVGFFTDPSSSCKLRPLEVQPGDNVNTSKFQVPATWTNTEATGIAPNDDIVGSTTFASGAQPAAGWFLANTPSATPAPFWCCGGSTKHPTTFNGVTRTGSPPSDVVVGTYTVGSATHGFTFNETSGLWTYPLDYPTATYTVINGINEDLSICGWYQASANGPYNGFVGIVAARIRKHH